MEVVAFVGPAGSGKSHRASLVAHQYQCDAIIDDGLLIRDGKILAGQSAKREDTKMAAVKRAIFLDGEHRAEVRGTIRKHKVERILILGTSDEMVDHITDALDLPRPEQTVSIEAVATPAQIRLAQRKRRQEGKHVIPAPTFEVKKTFSGYLVHPLRFLLKRHDDEDALSVEKSVVRPTFSSLGRFFIADTVITTIASHACGQVEGIARVARAAVQSSPAGVTIEMELILRYGFYVWDVLEAAQGKVKEGVEQITAMNVLAVDLHARRLSLE